MTLNDLKIRTKVILVVAAMSCVVLLGGGYAAFQVQRINDQYSDITARLDVSAVLLGRASSLLALYGRGTYALDVEVTDEGNRRLLRELNGTKARFDDLMQQVKAKLPELDSDVTGSLIQVAAAMQACAGPVKQASETSSGEMVVKAAARLKAECDTPVAAALDGVDKFIDKVMAMSARQSNALAAHTHATIVVTLGTVFAGVGVGAAFGIWMATSKISAPLTRLSETMRRLANRDFSALVEGSARGDEVGIMARTVELFKAAGLEQERMIQREQESQDMREQSRRAIENLTGSFDRAIRKLLETMSNSANELASTAQAMTNNANLTLDQSSSATGANQQASSGVQTVAAGAEELSASIREISRQVMQSSTTARQAAQDAEATNAIVASLAENSSRIGEVVQLINGIASQTNLLALNATIESARAGDAGKGFAVVAGEVKALASQTGRATEEISAQIKVMQAETERVVTATRGIVGRIAELDSVASAIAAAVEEQSAATAEIARNAQVAAEGTERATTNIRSVKHAASSTGAAAGEVLSASQTLAGQVTEINREVSNFLSGVRAA